MNARQRKRPSDRQSRMKERTLTKARNLRNTSRVLTLSAGIQGMADTLSQDSGTLFDSLETMETSARELSSEACHDFAAIESLNESAGFAVETVDDILHVWEEASQSFGALAEHALLLFDSIQREESSVLGMNDSSKELMATVESCVSAVGKTRDAADRFDVAGLNMILESGKKTSESKAFALLGEEVQKAAGRANETVSKFDELCAEATAAVSTAFSGSAAIGERYRTVMVLAKSIGNTFGELSAEIESLFEAAESISLALDENIAAAGILEDHAAMVMESAEELEPALSFADGSLEDTKNCADLCADFAYELSLTVDRMEDDSAENLDGIRMIADDYSSLAGNYGEEYDLGAGALDVASIVLARLDEAKTSSKTVIAAVSENTDSARDSLGKLYSTAGEISDRFKSTSEAFDGFIGEINALRAHQADAVESLQALDTLSLEIIGATDAVRDSSIRASFFAVTGKLEALRAEKGAAKYTKLAAGLDEVSASLESAGDEIAAVSEMLGQQTELNAGQIMAAHRSAGVIESTALRDELAEIKDSLILPAQEDDLLVNDSFESLATQVTELVNAQKDSGKNLATLKKNLSDAITTLSGQKIQYENIRLSSEKLTKLLDDVESGDI